MTRHSEPTPISDLLGSKGFAERVREYQEQQPWFRLLRSDDESDRAEGRRLLAEAAEQRDRDCAPLVERAWAALQAGKGGLEDPHGLGDALAKRVREIGPKLPDTCRRAVYWWTRSEKALLVAAAGQGDEARLAAALVVSRASGRYVHANELQRRGRDNEWVTALATTRLLALVGLFAAGEDERTFYGSLLDELLDVRERGGLKTILVSPLDRTALAAVVSQAVRERLSGTRPAWLWGGKEGA